MVRLTGVPNAGPGVCVLSMGAALCQQTHDVIDD